MSVNRPERGPDRARAESSDQLRAESNQRSSDHDTGSSIKTAWTHVTRREVEFAVPGPTVTDSPGLAAMTAGKALADRILGSFTVGGGER